MSATRRWLIVHQNAELYGADRVLADVATALRRTAEVEVLLPVDGPLVDELARRGVSARVLSDLFVLRKSALHPKRWPVTLLAVVRSVRSLRRELRRSAPTDVYVNTLTLPTAAYAARRFGARVTVHVHEAEPQLNPLIRRALTSPTLLADHVVVISDVVRRFVVGSWPRLDARTVVVRNPVRAPLREFESLPAARPDRLEVLLPGRWSPRKGTDLAISAVAQARRAGVPLRLTLLGSTFAGYEWYERDLRAQADRELPDTVFAPFAHDPDQIWRAMHVTVVPSRVEPYGLVAAESMARGRVTVVSRVDGLPEIVADGVTGTVSALTPSALADAIVSVWEDWDGARRRAERGREWAGQWTADRFADDLLGHIDRKIDNLTGK